MVVAAVGPEPVVLDRDGALTAPDVENGDGVLPEDDGPVLVALGIEAEARAVSRRRHHRAPGLHPPKHVRLALGADEKAVRRENQSVKLMNSYGTWGSWGSRFMARTSGRCGRRCGPGGGTGRGYDRPCH